MTASIIIPGIGGSGPDHWQSLWEERDERLMRFRPESWEHPDLRDWIASLDAAVVAVSGTPYLIAHSLGCLLVAHWVARFSRPIAGAFLVSVPDPDSPAFPREARAFAAVPQILFPFPALVVASSDDPFATLDYSHERARQWDAGCVVAGANGHINAASGLGHWEQGAALFEAFRAGVRA